jgi:hypothetical protein
MAKYEVHWTLERWFKVEIEAESREAAEHKFWVGEYENEQMFGTEIQEGITVIAIPEAIAEAEASQEAKALPEAEAEASQEAKAIPEAETDEEEVVWQSTITAGMVKHLSHSDIEALSDELNDAIVAVCNDFGIED